MTNKLVVIINSLKVPKIKKILRYEMKFLVPNYSCFQNPLTRGLPPPDPSSVCPLYSNEFVEPPPPPKKKNSWARDWIVCSSYHETARCNFMFMDSGRHSDVLHNQLRPAVRKEHRGLSSCRVSAAWQRPTWNREAHPGFKTGVVTLSSKFTRFGTTAIFTTFGPLQDALRRNRFRVDDEVKESACDHLAQQPRVLVLRNLCLSERLEDMCRRWWGLHWRLMSPHSVFLINNFIYSFRFSFEWPLYMDNVHVHKPSVCGVTEGSWHSTFNVLPVVSSDFCAIL